MNQNNMADHLNILLLKNFRIKYGFTQMELARYFKTTRSQINMAERLERPLSEEAETLFLQLKDLLEQAEENTESNKTNYITGTKIPESRWLEFGEDCRGRLITMLHQKRKLELQLPELKEEALIAQEALEKWQRIKPVIEHAGMQISAGEMTERVRQKLISCDELVQLTNQLQIKILSAGVEVLRQFLEEHSF